MKKATHIGECQVCGSVQKLPEGVLAKHGYTVRFSFFEGTCWGSGHKPFEQDISLIKGAIERAKDDGISQLQTAQQLLNDWNPTHVWINIWNKGNWNVRGHNEWKHIKIEELTTEHGVLFYGVDAPESEGSSRHRIETYGAYDRDPAMQRILQYRYLNARYAEERITRAKQLRGYVYWQTERIKGWKPKKLEPVKEAERKRCPVAMRGTTMSGRPRHCNLPVIPGTSKCERHTDPREALQP